MERIHTEKSGTHQKTNTWNGVAISLLVIGLIGGLNWGLIGLFNFNLVAAIFGTGALARVLYVVVGLCSAAAFFFLPKLRYMDEGRKSARTTHIETTRTGVRP
jgi:uncharacterized protein